MTESVFDIADRAQRHAYSQVDMIVAKLAADFDVMEARTQLIRALLNQMEQEDECKREIAKAREAVYDCEMQLEYLKCAIYDVPYHVGLLAYEQTFNSFKGAAQ